MELDKEKDPYYQNIIGINYFRGQNGYDKNPKKAIYW
jgi:TPR repeat protein